MTCLLRPYADFLSAKTQSGKEIGFEPAFMPKECFDFQRTLIDWSVRRGRGAILADCGLGKTLMELSWAENMVRHTNRPALLMEPLGTLAQVKREAEKFGVDAEISRDGHLGKNVTITNYEKLHLFSPDDFSAVVCGESSILKNFDGVRRNEITEFLRTVPFRLLSTATAAPNDYDELGTSSEALGELGYQDMISRFFKQETKKDYLGWGRTAYRLRGHAEEPFWRWVCSWARACRKPSDLGGDDTPFILPPLEIRENLVKASSPRNGFLFDVGAITLQEQQEEQRRTIQERCEKAAELVNDGQPAIVWTHLNPEGDLCEKLISGSVQVSGRDSDEEKEEKYAGFVAGQFRVLVSKPQLAGFGLNFQHCAHQTCFPSHSFERWYQAIRRSWRFGQKRPVTIDVISTEGSSHTLANLQRKQEAAEHMFSRLVSLMCRFQAIERTGYGSKKTEVPPWL